jgi:hypothetical protein
VIIELPILVSLLPLDLLFIALSEGVSVPPKGLRCYWKSDYVKGPFDEAIDAQIAQAANTPRELSLMHLCPIDGAVHPLARMTWSAKGHDMFDGHRRGRSEFPECRGTAVVGQTFRKAVHS